MKLTAQEEYGLRCILQIARRGPGATTIGEIADAEALTTSYVYKLMRLLRQAGIVDSTLGKRGGYRLGRPADTISVAEVMSVLGGKLYSQEFCTRFSGQGDQCVHESDCAVRALWVGIENLVNMVLSNCTIAELICSEEEMSCWVCKQIESAPSSLIHILAKPRKGRRPTLSDKRRQV